MTVVLHDDPAEFDALARPFYARDTDRHTIALTVLDSIVRGVKPAAALATVHDATSALVGALVCTQKRPPVVSGVAPGQAPAVVDALADAGFRAPGVSGPTVEGEAYAAAHVARHGGSVQVIRATRLFALDTLVPPRGVPGAARRAHAGDVELLHAWRARFVAEVAPGEPAPEIDEVARGLADPEHGETLWEVDGRPAAQATARTPVAGMSRVGPVYTPPELRGHGYAAAVTAAAAQRVLDLGARRVLLFTDLANPVTNRLYPRIGFRPVHDALDLEFVG